MGDGCGLRNLEKVVFVKKRFSTSNANRLQCGKERNLRTAFCLFTGDFVEKQTTPLPGGSEVDFRTGKAVRHVGKITPVATCCRRARAGRRASRGRASAPSRTRRKGRPSSTPRRR